MWAEIAFLILSISLLVLGIMLMKSGTYLLKNGRRTKAIVYKNNFKGVASRGLHYPVVRFLTEDKVWITKELSIGYLLAMEEGRELTVIYDPKDPSIVEIASSLELEILPSAFIILGLGGLVIIVLEIIDVTNFLS